jgi:hypothetical protein
MEIRARGRRYLRIKQCHLFVSRGPAGIISRICRSLRPSIWWLDSNLVRITPSISNTASLKSTRDILCRTFPGFDRKAVAAFEVREGCSLFHIATLHPTNHKHHNANDLHRPGLLSAGLDTAEKEGGQQSSRGKQDGHWVNKVSRSFDLSQTLLERPARHVY